ncbi:hypothetical protein [Paractinoplanes globisporus]|jgi:hypothetical protein|uniref:Rod shape-determining protein MreD n=1 Tax=Paractinoplanes globisporus TaxID=113565 RepID=A0ABW6WDX9_9ACTN|nr:hypothetical protein [Actinoplanes globisporus]
MFGKQMEAARLALSRATAIPFAVRFGVALSGLIAMMVAWPSAIVATEYSVILVLVAIYPAFAPRGRGATFSALVVVGGWLADTVGYESHVALWRVLTIATLLYLGHTLTALAAVLPYDAIVSFDMLGGWLLRAGAVVLVSAVLTVFALGLSADLAGSAFLLATLLGIACAVGATLLIARLLRRA